MGKKPKPFVFTLTPEEGEEIKGAVGSGGYQELHRRITEELQAGSQVTFDDGEMGEMIRHMTQYGSGGFQSHLKRAFRRSLCDLLDL